jgi:hypothetical protein
MSAATGMVRSLLEEALDLAQAEGEVEPGTRWMTFADAGLMTNDEGLVLRLADGSEFQLTIVQSSYVDAEDDDEGCEGHESLAGQHMGETVYCDGSCR